MAELKLDGYGNGFSWQITGLGNSFNTQYYESAGITTYKITQETTNLDHKGDIDTVDAKDNYDYIYTKKRDVDYDPGEYTFYAWCKAKNGTYYPAGSADVIVEKVYKIYFDEPYGYDYVEVLKNKYPPDIDPPSQSGFRFLGYFTDPQDEADSYTKQYYNSDGEAIKKYDGSYDSITIYSHWEKLYKIYFEEEYGDDYIEVAKGEYIPEVDIPQKGGYRFLGYWTQKNGLGVQYYNADGTPCNNMKYDGSSDHVTLYAYWEKTNTITLSKEGGSGGTSSVTVTKGEKVPSIKVPTRKNYSFLGYFTQRQSEADETIVQYYDSAGNSNIIWDYDKDITIYAHWLDGSLFAWTKPKNAGVEWNLTTAEWNGLTAFVNARRSALGKTQVSFTVAKVGKAFTAGMYNEVVDAIGEGTTVKPGWAITATLMNEIVTNANNMK